MKKFKSFLDNQKDLSTSRRNKDSGTPWLSRKLPKRRDRRRSSGSNPASQKSSSGRTESERGGGLDRQRALPENVENQDRHAAGQYIQETTSEGAAQHFDTAVSSAGNAPVVQQPALEQPMVFPQSQCSAQATFAQPWEPSLNQLATPAVIDQSQYMANHHQCQGVAALNPFDLGGTQPFQLPTMEGLQNTRSFISSLVPMVPLLPPVTVYNFTVTCQMPSSPGRTTWTSGLEIQPNTFPTNANTVAYQLNPQSESFTPPTATSSDQGFPAEYCTAVCDDLR